MLICLEASCLQAWPRSEQAFADDNSMKVEHNFWKHKTVHVSIILQ